MSQCSRALFVCVCLAIAATIVSLPVVADYTFEVVPEKTFEPSESDLEIGSSWRVYFEAGSAMRPMLFGDTGGLSHDPDRYAFVLILVDGVWKSVNFPDHGDFVNVYESEDKKRIWAFTQYCVEGCHPDVVLYKTEDAGLHWRQHVIKKPHYHMGIHELRMRSDGHGELSFRSDDDGDGSVYSFPKGLYTLSTNDWGATWSEPIFTPGILDVAQVVKDGYAGPADSKEILSRMESKKSNYLSIVAYERRKGQSK